MNNLLYNLKKVFENIKEENLLDQNYLENNLITTLGLNNENLNEQPIELKDFFGTGIGLKIWQYPNQFSKYLILLSSYAKNIGSYLEIGCRHGGTFILTCEYLKRINEKFNNATAIDIINISNALSEYLNNKNINIIHMQTDSQSKDFENFISKTFYDLVFIDGDHSYEGVKKDAEVTRNFSNIQVFHDTVNEVCPGVGQYWNEIKNTHKDIYNFFDFTDQYESVNGTYLGIGVAIRKEWITI